MPNPVSFFQAAVASILLYGCTTWTLTKRLEKKLDGNYTRMLRAILNKSWRQHPTRHQLYGHLPPITKTIQVRRTRHAGHCWRSRDELISDVLLWTPAHGRAKAGRPARTYIQQLCEDTGCCPEDLPVAREGQGYPCYQYDMMMMMIYIVIQRQTVSLYLNSSVWLDMRDASSWNRNPTDFSSVGYSTPNLSSFQRKFLVYIHIHLSATGMVKS